MRLQPQARKSKVAVVIPVLNEEEAIGKVLAELPAGLVDRVVVVDNGSTDGSAEVARGAGAEVVSEPVRGYGRACLRGLKELEREPPEVVVFLDGDWSDSPGEMPRLLEPIVQGEADLVLGSRTLGQREPGALPAHALIGNRLASVLFRILYGAPFTDLGPFRAIRYESLRKLDMRDAGFGWTAEMQAKACRLGLKVREVPVSYRRRIGASKISGSLKGSLKAGFWILFTILRYRLSRVCGRG